MIYGGNNIKATEKYKFTEDMAKIRNDKIKEIRTLERKIKELSGIFNRVVESKKNNDKK